MAVNNLYNQNITRVVSNFNRKVARLQKAGYDLLPSKVSVREIKKRFDNKTELNTYLRDLQRFSRRGAEEVITIGGKDYTKYEVDVFKRKLRRERYKLNKEIVQAKGVTPKYPMQHDIFLANLQAKRNTLSNDWQDLIGQKVGINLFKQDSTYLETYNNYFSILFQDAYQIGFEDEKIEHIKSQLLKLKPRQFIRALEDDPNIQYIFEYYHALTRTSYSGGDNTAYDAFQELYENIGAIIDKYK